MLIDKAATMDHDDCSATPQVSLQECEKKEEVSGTLDRMQVKTLNA